MLTGFYVLRGTGAAKFTRTFLRVGLSATFFVQVLELIGSPTDLTVFVEHKNADDAAFTTAGSFATISSVSVASLSVSALKEQVRLSLNSVATNAWEGFYVLVPEPAWRPY